MALLVVLALVGAAGVPRLTLDPQAPFQLPADHPTAVATQTVRDATGGDDVVLVALYGDQSLLAPDGVAAIEAIREALAGVPALEGVRAVTTAPLLATRDGLLTAETPLLPTPTDDAAARVLADPFTVGPLIGADGTIAIIPGWIRRDGAGPALVAQATQALADAETRATPAGAAVSKAVNEARLAVVLSQEEGPPDAAVARRLTALASADGPAAALVAEWLATATSMADDPASAALTQVRQALTAVPLPDGVQATVLGAPAVAEAAEAAFPLAVGLLLVGLALAGALAAGLMGSVAHGARAAAGVGLAALLAAGLMGWAGVPLHGVSALAIVAAAGLAGLLGAAGEGSLRPIAVAGLPTLGVCLGMSAVEGALLAGLAGAASGVVVGGTLARLGAPLRPEGRSIGGPSALMSPALQAAAVLALGCAASLVRPVGLDPARLLDARDPVGAAVSALDARAGMGAPAQLVFTGVGDRPMAAPEALATLQAAQAALSADEAVRATVSWADFLGAIHQLVSGEQGLPADAALVDQYLLLFGRPDATRPLVATDLSVGSGLVRLAPGQAAALARLTRVLDDSPVALGGEAVVIAVASERTARAAGAGLLLCILLALGLTLRQQREALDDLLFTATAVIAGAAAAAWWAHALTLEALLAGALIFGAARSPGSPPAALLLGGLLAMLSPVVPIASLGLGLAAGGATLLGLRALR